MWKYQVARALLKEQGRTTTWLANQVGLDVRSLRNILRGTKPSLPVIKLMAIALNCEESDLYEAEASTA
jgi:lambda repressor-like predicted transcriptional regulator